MSEIPEPSVPEPGHNGMITLPWETALFAAVANLEERLADCNRTRAEALAELSTERARVREARRRLENWKLRQNAWTSERTELLERLHRKGS